MEEVASTPKLVDPTAFAAEGALTATLPRSDIEAAVQDDAGADLLLEIARIQNGERDDRKIKVSWQKDELEDLLRRASGDPITLTFSREELERMLDDPDFEAHGLREKVLVLTVAAVTAAGAAGSASAMVSQDGGGTASPSGAVAGIVSTNRSPRPLLDSRTPRAAVSPVRSQVSPPTPRRAVLRQQPTRPASTS